MGLKPINVIKADLGIEPGGRIQRFFVDTCEKYMYDYVPYASGWLRDTTHKGENYIDYESPYARYIYYGKKMVMPHNGKSSYYSEDYGHWSEKGVEKTLTDQDLVFHTPGTGPYWDKLMWSAEGGKVLRDVEKEIRKRGNR